MSRIRTLKPTFFRSRSLAKVPLAARVTFQGLWCEADDHGRGIADARLLHGVLWPLDDDVSREDVADHLLALARTGHIQLYEVDGEDYYEVVEWEKHQAASHRRGEAVHPSPPGETPTPGGPHDDACKNVRDASEIVLEKGEGNREKGTGNAAPATHLALLGPVVGSIDFDREFWLKYPKRKGVRQGKSATKTAWSKLSHKDQRAACRALPNYARAAGEFPKDPERYLKQRLFEDHLEAPTASVSYDVPPVVNI